MKLRRVSGQSALKRQPTAKTSRPTLNYYRAKQTSDTKSPFIPKVKQSSKKFFGKAIDLAILLLVLFCLVYSLLVRPDSDILTSSEVYHSAAEYKAAANKLLNNISSRTKLTINEKNLADNIQKQFPEIASVKIELPLFAQNPVFRLDISAPSFNLTNGSGSYILDSQGVVVNKTSALPNIKNLPTLDDQSGFSTQVGKHVLSSSAVNFINTVISQSKHSKISIKSMALPPLAQELDLHTNDKPYFVKFYLGGDAIVQTGQFIAARHQFDAKNIQPNEYLDVRVNGKIFYK